MAFKIIWSEPALDDLASLTGFIAQDNPPTAERIGCAILDKIKYLAGHPLPGRRVPEIRRGDIHELIKRPYRIIYRVNEQTKSVEIIRIWHSARGEPDL
jgi:toxin ParE1/3/4